MKPVKNLSKARILLTNDDGIEAAGIQTLREELEGLCEVLVVAPMSERSGSGCGLSVNREFAVRRMADTRGRVWGWAVDGTPADCVKFAVLSEARFKPDLVLSGINRGSNLGNSVWYSGTVAGAMEATLLGLRAMAVSLSFDWTDPQPTLHYETSARVVREMLPWLLTQTWQPRTFWNLNLPNCSFDALGGIRIARQGTSFFVDNFTLERREEETEFFKNVGQILQESEDRSQSDDAIIGRGEAALSLMNMDLSMSIPPAAREALEREFRQLIFQPVVPDVSV